MTVQTNRSDPAQHAWPGRHRRLAAGLLLTTVLGLAGCGGAETSTAPEPTAQATETFAGPTVTPSVVPSEVPSEEVMSGGEGTTTEADAVLEVDGTSVATGTARCARAIDESTGDPTVRLILASDDGSDQAEVVVTDSEDPRVVSAVLMRGDEVALAGAEGLDGSTLGVVRDGDEFSVSGSLKDQADGSTHELVLRATCQDL